MSLLRRDPVTGRWTILIPERSIDEIGRVHSPAPERSFHEFCPFCPGNEGKTPPELMAVRGPGTHENGPGWRVRVVPNKFPVLDPQLSPSPSTEGIYDKMGGFGVHEVVIESPDHAADLSTISLEHAVEVVLAWHARIRAICADSRVRSIVLFRNRGAAAGASLAHPHTQIIGLPIIPKLVMEEIQWARRYYEWKERCVFCDMVRDEQTQGVRVVRETPHYLAFAPYASRFAYETWVVPRRHRAHFKDANDGELKELAALLRDVARRLSTALDAPPYNLLLHTAPSPEGETPHYHWHIEIMPRLTRVAGFEWGTGFYVNPVMPESAAQALADVSGL